MPLCDRLDECHAPGPESGRSRPDRRRRQPDLPRPPRHHDVLSDQHRDDRAAPGFRRRAVHGQRARNLLRRRRRLRRRRADGLERGHQPATGAVARSKRWPGWPSKSARRWAGDLSVPIVALVDGPLLPWLRPDPQRIDKINEEIDFVIAQLERLRAARAIPVGYVDRPGSGLRAAHRRAARPGAGADQPRNRAQGDFRRPDGPGAVSGPGAERAVGLFQPVLERERPVRRAGRATGSPSPT